jgi:SPX domain protein involved in polyphosphate accumulation
MQNHNLRREIKFVARETQYFHLIRWIRLHSSGFSKPYPDRWINNVYYDTYNYHSYTGNLSGESFRSKIRFRWYGELNSIKRGSLEIKMKRNSFGWKIKHSITSLHTLKNQKWKKITMEISRQLSGKYKHLFLSHPMPTIVNRYYREYFVSNDNKIRITIDRKQSVYDQRYKSIANMSTKSFIPDNIVVEVKFDREDYSSAMKVIHGMPIRSSRNSKYMNSVNAVTGNSILFP